MLCRGLRSWSSCRPRLGGVSEVDSLAPYTWAWPLLKMPIYAPKGCVVGWFAPQGIFACPQKNPSIYETR